MGYICVYNDATEMPCKSRWVFFAYCDYPTCPRFLSFLKPTWDVLLNLSFVSVCLSYREYDPYYKFIGAHFI